MPFCTRCGHEAAQVARFCNECGTAIAPVSPSGPTPPAARTGPYKGVVETNDRGIRWIPWLLVGAAILIVVYTLLPRSFGFSSDHSESVRPLAPSDAEGAARPIPILTFAEAKSRAITVSHDDLFRFNERFVGETVVFRGKIVQVVDAGSAKYQFRANVTPVSFGWDDAVFLRYEGSRFVEDDIIEFVGRVNGLVAYEAVFGQTINIPDIEVTHIKLITN